MLLFAGDTPVVAFQVAIGPGGDGPKGREGDNVTPVGRYHVVSRTPSQYTIFMRLDYPNAQDRARFNERKAKGELPRGATIGGDIGIHGSPASFKAGHKARDWTWGCVAVDDDEIRAIARLVPDGTQVDIED